MCIDIDRERLLTLSAAAVSLPHRPHSSTVSRWVQTGCRGIRLESVLLGGRRYTSKEALRRFIERTTQAAEGTDDDR
ncbi:MAG: DUF1580 domain-containing protein [Rhodopirellula sp.]|nr:DUF1580 domain-containing protein [Rhodopirellula sp.]